MLARLIENEITKSPVTIAVVAAVEPVTVCRMATIGLLEARASSTEPIETRITITMTYPRTPFMKIDQNMARGTADFAFRTSSLIWIAESNPIMISMSAHKKNGDSPVKDHTHVNMPR